MTGSTGSNHPDGRESFDKVRQLQRRLWRAAKRQPGRRFHALMDRIYRRDVLWEAWRRVKKNRGAAGVDAMTLAAVEQLPESRLEEMAPGRDHTIYVMLHGQVQHTLYHAGQIAVLKKA